MDKIYKYFKEINKLNQLIRTGWLIRKVKADRLESVSEHAFTTCLLALSVIDKYNLSLDVEKLLKMILIHEVGEIDVGDIPVSDTEKHKNKHEKELQGVIRVSNILEEQWMLDLWLEFEEKKSKEAQFAYKMDKLNAVLQAKYYSEVTKNPNLFTEFYETAIKDCGEFLEVADE